MVVAAGFAIAGCRPTRFPICHRHISSIGYGIGGENGIGVFENLILQLLSTCPSPSLILLNSPLQSSFGLK